MNKKDEIVFNIRILDIKVLKFSQFELLQEFDESKFPLVEFQTSFNFKVIENESKINSIITVKIKMIETNEYFAELIVESSFSVTPIEKLITKKEDETYDVKGIVLYNIASVSVSTIRGILFERLKGSMIQKEIYPLTNLAEIFLKDKSLN